MRETHTVPGHVLAVPLDARSCWDSLIYLYIITSDMYIHVYNGETEEEEKEKEKRRRKSSVRFGFIFTRGGLHTESRGLIIFNPREVFLPFHGERGCCRWPEGERERERGVDFFSSF
jgi:hypothetical protein